jgi:hypothetical protein
MRRSGAPARATPSRFCPTRDTSRFERLATEGREALELKQLEQAILRQDVPLVQPPEERHNLPAAVTTSRVKAWDVTGNLATAAARVTIRNAPTR